ncbi:MAG: SGNH/GDSL hydrolase family protein [Acetobacteraceae bacterium]|nr:SGNH/GDSL hydrolase family protein [Acetobacteraceae bacterium]
MTRLGEGRARARAAAGRGSGLTLGAALLALLLSAAAATAADREAWITTWAATPAPRWADELPAPFNVPEVLQNQTVRQIARISVGGKQVRVVLSNEFGTKPVTIGASSVALAGKDGALASDPKPLAWGGRAQMVIPPAASVLSDPVDLAVDPLASLAVSFYLPQKTALSTVHWDGVQTGYISDPGDFTQTVQFKTGQTTKSRLLLSRIMTDAKPGSSAVVFFGDSITDGNNSTVDANHRWPDHIAERLQAEGHPDVAVVNEAYSGDRVLANGMGQNALARFDESVLGHPRVGTVVMMMGINDIGWPGRDSITPTDPEPSAEDVITGYEQIIDRAHAHGIRFVAVTLTPFADTFKGTPLSGYYTAEKEGIRESVNKWIRESGMADGVIDFDKVVEDPANPGHINPGYDSGDHLHPNDTGYEAMAKAVDLNVLLGGNGGAKAP